MVSGALYVTMISAHAKPIQRAVPWATLVPNVTQVHDVKANTEVSLKLIFNRVNFYAFMTLNSPFWLTSSKDKLPEIRLMALLDLYVLLSVIYVL